MEPFAFYPVFIGMVLSITSLTYLAVKEYDAGEAKTLSQLGGGHSKALGQFRTILWVCGTLFSVTVLFFIAPRLHSLLMYTMWLITYAFEVLLGIVPDHPGKQHLWHYVFAYGMALGFLVTAIYFALNLTGHYRVISGLILAGMIAMVLIAAINQKKFLFYELGYIYLSHLGIVVAALALR